jgi:uncharacterized protein (TIGR03435 family)
MPVNCVEFPDSGFQMYDGRGPNMRAAPFLCALFALQSFAQTFEVATMKLHPSGSPEGIATTQTGGPGTSDPTRITIINRTLHRLLIESYGLVGYQLKDPPDLDQVRYDLFATIPPGASGQDVRVMMQNLLIERLQLKVRHEHQVIPVYALLVGKRGPKFKPSSEPIDPAKQGISRSASGPDALKLTAVGQTIPQFVSALFQQTDHPIMDMTGLTGKYDFTLTFARRTNELSATAADARAEDAPTIFQAVQGQLGLKLEARKMPVDLVIVDSGQKVPLEN